ncbi:MAG: hypothetical protein HY308_17165 [Gammaproteobacteria bacterium]|nr:hypothetical protein [Gammaproteobacteria bacterium]
MIVHAPVAANKSAHPIATGRDELLRQQKRTPSHKNQRRLVRATLIFMIAGTATAATYWATLNRPEIATPAYEQTPMSSSMPSPVNLAAMENGAQQIEIQDGQLRVRINNVPLSWLLAEIGQQSRIAIHASAELGSQPISAELAPTPLAEGLLHILQGFDVFLFFGTGESTTAQSSAPTLKSVWIYRKRKGETLAPYPLTATGSNSGNQETPKHTSGVDFATMAGLQTQDPAVAIVELSQALQSADAKIRFSAVAASLENKIELPMHLLQQLAGLDPDREVRGLALTALTQHSNADASMVRIVAQMALNDSDPDVQAQAKGTLEYLDLAERSNDDVFPSPPPPQE